MNKKERSRIINRYIKIYAELAKKSKSELADIILSENPHIVKDTWTNPRENVRSMIRHRLGQCGQKSKHNLSISEPKILTFDIETMPLRGYIWGLWKQNIDSKTSLISANYFMVTAAWKWLGDNTVHYAELNPKEIKAEDDRSVLEPLCKAIEEADIVVGYNVDKFDVRHVNARRMYFGLGPMSPYQTIDLYKIVKKHFALPRYTLNFVSEKFLKLDNKMDTGGMKLWVDCWNGCKEAIAKMSKYNVQDVELTERVYLHLRPWIHNHPNMNLFVDEDIDVCTKCGHSELEYVGEKRTAISAYNVYKCKSCGGMSQSRLSSLNKYTSPNLKSI